MTFFITPVTGFFNGSTLADPTALPDLTNTANQQPLSVVFQNASLPAATCTAANLYFPGDGQIFIDTTQVAPGAGTTLVGTTVPQAKAITLIAVASPSGTPNLTPTYASPGASNPPSNFSGFGPILTLSGFTNSTAATGAGSNPYDVDVMERDAAGIVVPPPPGLNTCALVGVETAQIQTFLANNKCFIATAAFQSMDAAPILLLRKFRDDFLLHFSAGQAFVRWYYAWSPAAADWIIENPFFRLPVLSALIPLEILAFLVLHPALSLSGVVILAALALGLARMNTRLSRA